MQNNYERFLEPVFTTAFQKSKIHSNTNLSSDFVRETGEGSAKPVSIPCEFNGKDYLAFLLHINAEIEHGLMLQYLYAAYSIGGPQVPAHHQDKIRGWQETILGVAKEEMGHFISVQNVLKLMGASLNFGRTDYPWDTPFYPFPFTLEPLSLSALAKYVFAESPEGWIDDDTCEDAVEVKKYLLANSSVKENKINGESLDKLHRVGALFTTILSLIKDTVQVPDEVFQAKTYPFQAKFDEWGRGYTGNQQSHSHPGRKDIPDVLVVPLTCRDDAYNALLAISEQGEGPALTDNNGMPSHFDRFLKIFKEMIAMQTESKNAWAPSRNLAINPIIAQNAPPSDQDKERAIVNPEAKLWAHLFNIRYRMLLNYLAHSFLLDDGYNNNGAVSPRATIINSTFGEMYNLKSIANVLVQTPLDEKYPDRKMAGPTFSVPYTLEIPMGEINRWNEHLDTLYSSEFIVNKLIEEVSTIHQKYLYALRETDKKLVEIIKKIISAA